jgi:hypothetical protein
MRPAVIAGAVVIGMVILFMVLASSAHHSRRKAGASTDGSAGWVDGGSGCDAADGGGGCDGGGSGGD